MSQRLARFAFSIFFVMVLIIASAVAIGRAQALPTTAETFGFSVCNKKLCLWGIAPGVTRWSKALAILEEHGAVQRTLREDVYFVDSLRINIDYDPQTQLVTYIAVIDRLGDPLPISVGDTLDYLGTPCGFNPDTNQSKDLILIYPYAYLTLSIASHSISPASQISYIDLPSDGGNCGDSAAWPGFATAQRYWDWYLRHPASQTR